MLGRAKLTLLALVVVSSVGCDQVTKAIATSAIAPNVSLSYFGGIVRLWNTENPGGFLSLGADLSPIARAIIFGGFNSLIVLGGIFYVLRNEEHLRRLEVIALAHAAILQPQFEDPAVTDHLAFPCPYPPGEMARYVESAIAGRAAGTRYVWAIVEPDGRASGIALLKDVDTVAGTGELGYALGREFWGRGRATIAANDVMTFAFRTLRLQSLRAVSGALNAASLRVLEKLGFREEHRYEDAREKWPAPRTQVVLRATRESWANARQTAAPDSCRTSSR